MFLLAEYQLLPAFALTADPLVSTSKKAENL